jgi:glucan phosphoethanolaminetransferase (alkaline phosphatase superfamily)
MSEGRAQRAAANLAADLAPWCLAPFWFLWLYITDYHAPLAAIAPHLAWIAGTWISLAIVRTALQHWVPWPWLCRLLSASLASLILTALLLYYVLALLGLASWGRVITWPLIRTYAMQASDLAQILGYPDFLLPAVLSLFAATIFFYVYRFGSGRVWAAELRRQISRREFLAVLVSGLLLAGLLLARQLQFPAVAAQEPISLTFFSELISQQQSHSGAGTQVRDSLEDEVRVQYQPNREYRKRNVILIVGDALRPDVLGAYVTAQRSLTPRLDGLIAQRPAVSIKGMRAVCAESSCGLMALASSRYVHETTGRPLSLQEVLRRHGYAVHMILGGDHTNFYGLKKAYGEVDSYFDGSMQSARYMNDDRLLLDRVEALHTHTPAKPVMLQFHLMSTHGLGSRQKEFVTHLPVVNYYRHIHRSGSPVPHQLKHAARNYYANGVAQLDHIISELLGKLQRKGYLQDALVIITADHGESLGEQNSIGHAQQPWENALRIPFILIRFGHDAPPLPEHLITSQVDIAPTILRDLDMPIPATWRGMPLQDSGVNRTIYFQQGAHAGLYSLVDETYLWKYSRNWDDGREWAVDLASITDETVDQSDKLPPALLKHWRQQIIGTAAAVASHPPTAENAVEPLQHR